MTLNPADAGRLDLGHRAHARAPSASERVTFAATGELG
jgi:hypothetical protein